jgi:uncharacterized membrane protein
METKLLIVILTSFVFIIIGGIYSYLILKKGMLKKDDLENRPHLKR